MIRALLALLLALAAGPLAAQARYCSLPAVVPTPRPDLPSEDQPRRVLPIGSWTLAISWSPEYCRSRRDRSAPSFQCGGGNRFGFVLHGLWPDGQGKDWPQYCQATDILPERVIRQMLCVTPSAQLIQHEWAKHGTCIPGETPDGFFARARDHYGRLRFPDMDRLSRVRGLTVGRFARAFAAANRGLRPDMIRVQTKKQGWLDELWICMDMRQRYARCPSHQEGTAPSRPLRIWRGA